MAESGRLRRRRMIVAAPLLLMGGRSRRVSAQPSDAGTVRVVSGHAPGGQGDIIGRIVAARMGEILGQPVYFENRPGASGLIAARLVAKAPPDGRTLLVATASNIALARVVARDQTFDPLRDFALLARVAVVPTVLAVGSWVPATSVVDLVNYAKARPGKLNGGSGGAASTSGMSLELFKLATGTDVVNVPYSGLAPAVGALIARQVDLVFCDYGLIAPHARGGTVRLLATPASRRFAAQPSLPTFTELGVDVVVDSWVGIVTAAAVPRDTFAQLVDALAEVVRSDDVRRRLRQAGFEPFEDTPARFAAAVAGDVARYGDVARRLGIAAGTESASTGY